MTEEQRLEIYRFVKQTLEDDIKYRRRFCGFCHRLETALSEIDLIIDEMMSAYNEEDMAKYFPELYKYKPINADRYWFDITDLKPRLEIINKVIEEMTEL